MMSSNGTVHPWVAAGNAQLRFGTNLPGSGDWAKNRDFAQAIEELGFDSGMAGEHPAWSADCWITLAAYAAVTRRLRLVSISCVYYRSPQLLARHATDVDMLSGGRLVLGLGAGWAKGDFDFLGVPFPPVAERMRYLEATIQTVRQIWADPSTVTSELVPGHPITRRISVAPVQQPYIPLLVAGAGEKVILRLVTEYADMANIEAIKAPAPEDVRRKLDLVRRLCIEKGRSLDSMVRSHFVNSIVLGRNKDEIDTRSSAVPPGMRSSPSFRGMTPDELIAYYRPIIDAGINYIYFNQFGMDVPIARLFAESVMPELRDYYASTRK